jgi:integrase
MAKARSINERATVSFQWEGKRRVEYIGQPADKAGMRIAKRVATEVGVLISSGQFSWDHYRRIFPNSKRLPAPVTERTRWTLGDFCRQWLREQVGLTDRARQNYSSQLSANVLNDPIATMWLDEIHDGDLKQLQGRLIAKITNRGKRLSPTHANQVLTRLRTICATAKRRRLIDDNPAEPKLVPKLKQPRSLVDPLTRDEAIAVLDKATGAARNLFTILIGTGCRPSEALDLLQENVDTQTWLSFDVVEGKTEGSARTIHTNADTAAALEAQAALSTGALIFEGINLRQARDEWYRVLASADVRRRTLYQTRHTFAVLALEGSEQNERATLRDIADALGHVDLVQVTKTYLRWIPGSRKDAAVKAVEGLLAQPEASKPIDRVLSHLVRESGVKPMITDENENRVEAS